MLDFPGVTMTLTDEACWLLSETGLLTLSSAVVGGGFQSVRLVLNRHVSRDYDCRQPALDLQRFARQVAWNEPFIGLLTGVPINGTRCVTQRSDDLTVASVITAGVSNAMTAGISTPVVFTPGTINMVVFVDANLEVAAMVNAVITATESKVATLAACNVRSSQGELATGTSTDALVIACTGRGDPLPYAGPGTEVGYLIGLTVRECLIQALKPCGISVHPEF
ncbi:adenosylcobinamide amidohydrolase [Dictyobacter aurantiacus]|uniref:Adenosylcobinamide amidohydrolase n=1 Tax=Dictyobacter aurantiacus TaxID=1936993 RepID=A0A401Z961_9CHLR|nr:adenosylcobinamide amidohydrolase [Dictyobacter aurantiacus]GCE03336.1 hypothetical protein KDAU_06650 [Dictyobacter aurantiacus]